MTLFALFLLATSAQAAPLTLAEVLDAVDRENPSLLSARASSDIAALAPKRAWSAFLPSVSAGGSYTRNSDAAELAFPNFAAGFQQVDTPSGPTLVPVEVNLLEVQKQDQLGAQLRVQQGLLVPAAIPGVAAARAGAEASAWGTRAAERELRFGAAELYLRCVALDRAVLVTREHVALLQEHLRAAEIAYGAGAVPEIAVLKARLDVQQADQDRVRMERDHAAALGQLAGLMGSDDPALELVAPAAVRALFDGEDPLSIELSAATTEDLPTRLASEAGLEAARKQRASAVAGFLPTVGLGFTYQYSNSSGFSGKNTTWAASANVSVPIFDGGVRVRDVQEASARVRSAEAARDKAALDAAQQLRQAELDRHAATLSLATARESAALARRSWEAVETSFAQSHASPLDVADAAASLRGAELGVVSEAVNLAIADLHLALARGEELPPRYARQEDRP